MHARILTLMVITTAGAHKESFHTQKYKTSVFRVVHLGHKFYILALKFWQPMILQHFTDYGVFIKSYCQTLTEQRSYHTFLSTPKTV